MRNYQQTNMVDRVHKNVKYMLSEAREIISIKNRIPLTFNRNYDQSLTNIKHTYNQFNHSQNHQLNHSQHHEKRQGKPKIKGRMIKLKTQRQGEEESSYVEDRFQTLSRQQIKQLQLLSHLNKEEIQLVQTSRRSIKVGHLLRYNDPLLPPIPTKRMHRNIAKSSKDYFSFSIQPLQELKMKNVKTIESISSSNIISYLQKHKKKSNPFTSKNKQKPKKPKIKINVECEPWSNQADPTDVFFQI